MLIQRTGRAIQPIQADSLVVTVSGFGSYVLWLTSVVIAVFLSANPGHYAEASVTERDPSSAAVDSAMLQGAGHLYNHEMTGGFQDSFPECRRNNLSLFENDIVRSSEPKNKIGYSDGSTTIFINSAYKQKWAHTDNVPPTASQRYLLFKRLLIYL